MQQEYIMNTLGDRQLIVVFLFWIKFLVLASVRVMWDNTYGKVKTTLITIRLL